MCPPYSKWYYPFMIKVLLPTDDGVKMAKFEKRMRDLIHEFELESVRLYKTPIYEDTKELFSNPNKLEEDGPIRFEIRPA